MDRKNSKAEEISSNKNRLIVLIILFSCVFIFYIIYLFNLQVVNTLLYETRARQVSRRVMPLNSLRGEIYDTHFDIPLVLNTDSFAVEIIPGELTRSEMDEVFHRLAPLLSMDVPALHQKVPPAYYRFFQPVELKGSVSLETITRIAEHIDQFPGITWSNKPVRTYIETGSIAHVLGYVGNITSEEYQVLYNKGYNFNSVIGKSGIERQYDSLLRGINGRIFKKVDVKGRWMHDAEVLDIEPPVNGNNLVLTIDRKIQELAEEALGERMGSVVVLKPATGEILALVSYPWYNPNLFYTDQVKEEFRKLALDSRYPFVNRAIQSSYAPASAFKIVMSTAILEEEAFPIEQTIRCEGTFRLGDRDFRCHNRQGHGPVALADALAQSCDVYYYTVGLRHLGIDTIADYSRRFGLGEKSGIDLPGEVAGLVPTPQWKERTYNYPWLGGDTVNTTIGQGYLMVSPLQMANIVAMTVNRGVVYKPHLLKEIRHPITGELIEKIEPEIMKTANIRKETFDKVQEHMRYVITDGTARLAITTKSVEIAGKTGTGEVGYDDRWHAWFAANGPYDAPPEEQVVVVTMVEASNEWEWWAIRAANIVFQGIFAEQTYDEAIDALRWGWLRNPRRPQ